MGRIRDELKRRGLAKNTVIIFTSDHGFFLGEYGFAGKWTPHDVSIRIPLVVYDPGSEADQRGQRRREMALSIDMAPTILEFAGIEPPERMQGVSLKPLVDGEPPDQWRDSFFHRGQLSGVSVPRTRRSQDILLLTNRR